VASFGLLVIASWYAHWRLMLQMIPNSAPMQYNTALCFVLLGIGLALLTTRRATYAAWAGGAAYVHAHTEATFTHGICPVCSDKVKKQLSELPPQTA
jgi:hypothetical protein